MGMDLYYLPVSSPCRAVQLAAKALGLNINLIKLDMSKKEHLAPDFIKINPQHTVPTLVDDDFIIWESRAIIAYLVNKYGKDDSLYPKDPRARAVVDHRLYFDVGLYTKYTDYLVPLWYGNGPGDPEKLQKIHECLKILEKFLEGNDWSAGANMTIADIALVTTISFIEIMKIEYHNYPNITRWYSKCKKTVPGYNEINQKQLDDAHEMYAQIIKKL